MMTSVLARLASLAALLALSATPSLAQEEGHAPVLDIGAGGRPVGEAWSRSPIYAQHGMAATCLSKILLRAPSSWG